MKHIDQYLGKKNLTPVLDKKRAYLDILFTETGLVIDSKYISFSGKVVYCKVSPYEKTQILLKKKSILSQMKTSQKLSFFTDIQ